MSSKTVPINPTRQATYENSAITAAAERRAQFTAGDHRRLYGMDFADRLQNAGFCVTTFRLSQPEEVKYALLPMEWLTIAVKTGKNPASASP
jgi:hypothetical protein